MKKKIGTDITLIVELPYYHEDQSLVVGLDALLQTRTITRNELPLVQRLIRWQNLPKEDATWEGQSFIQSQFLVFTSSWGQEGSSRRGIVTYKYIREERRLRPGIISCLAAIC